MLALKSQTPIVTRLNTINTARMGFQLFRSVHMKALVYEGPDQVRWKDAEKPTIIKPTDALVKVTATTICGSDLHIIHGGFDNVKPGTIIGHEGLGIIEALGDEVQGFSLGDKVVIKCITSCGHCASCKKNLQANCDEGGILLGGAINGTQAEYVRIPHATHSLMNVTNSKLSDKELILLSDILPTGYEVGVLNGKIQQGDIVAIMGAGPIGISALVTCQKFLPKKIIVIDLDDNRLAQAAKMGATMTINPSKQNVEDIVKDVDVAIECVGRPDTFETCQHLLGWGGRLANVGVHTKPATLHLEKLWEKCISITTGLVSAYSSEELMDDIHNGRLNPGDYFISHELKMSEMEKAYDIFKNAAQTGAIKLFITRD